jgi:mannose-1-phosphate guanylyltransferase
VQAVVLVGGEGTRLRPLTETIPKPLIPLVDKPFLDHVLDHLAAHGVHEVILSSSYLEGAFDSFIRARHGDPAITWITEEAPLGTAGAIANAARHLHDTFFVLNGDILTDLDLTALLEFHRAKGAVATITLEPVSDARPYGLVSLDEDAHVREFREKPADPVPGVINAGTYVLEPVAIEGVATTRSVSIEREVFPELIDARVPVYGYVAEAYWMDLGTPEKYLRASFDALDGKIKAMDYPAPYISPDAGIDIRAHLGRWVVAGPNVVVYHDAEVEDSVLLAGAMVGQGAKVRDSILGPHSMVGQGAVVDGAVLADGAGIREGVRCAGARVSAGSVFEG